ncbi:SGNH/GDSL hydrolase family protein [Candidatus Dojkabacteria bacterium]|uniref:SGNH/GDSL hydrolase family protein n=1 Tax=Candidatus Dojkabacteria bacterium TaxID=2099670 RepID=A0A955L3N3_9BACT|nr:SGNH/GDSL hydrolase family protein [Candidatus Dojkabacteria bacterium]
MNTNPNSKRILCYGDSNTWGWIPNEMGRRRFGIDERWPGILQNKLGDNYEVIEEGLGGRTTATDDPRPEFPERNGLKSLPAILESHMPLDLVIIMLGTADTKEMFNLSAEDIQDGLRNLVKTTYEFKTLENSTSPEVLIIVPPIIIDTTDFASKLFNGGTEKSKQLVNLYKQVADEENCHYLCLIDEVVVNEDEGIHLTKESHAILGQKVFRMVEDLFAKVQ